MPRYVVDLAISGPEMLRYYRGRGQTVIAAARSGQTLRFPVQWLRPHVAHAGVYGTFVLDVDASNRLQRLRRLPEKPAASH